MKLPGRGWLQYEASPAQNDQTELVQTAYFAPKGLFGLIYWYGIYPLHGIIFAGTIEEIAKRAELASSRVVQSADDVALHDDQIKSMAANYASSNEVAN